MAWKSIKGSKLFTIKNKMKMLLNVVLLWQESYEEPQRLSFQIHGQEGPNSYRFGYDTGIG